MVNEANATTAERQPDPNEKLVKVFDSEQESEALVVKGLLEIKFGDEILCLSPGDAILFQADTPHSYRNTSKTELLAYLVMTYVEPGL